MKRLTVEQKLAAVKIVLFNAIYPMSRQEIARKMGLTRGEAIQQVLEHLRACGWITFRQSSSNFGDSFIVWELTPPGRKTLRNEGWDDGWPEGA
jgi:predicted ArsR family transcriptional regulator